MRAAVSTSIAALLAVRAALSCSASALAATVAIPNACWWTVPGEWNNETLTFTGTASVERTVAGTPITLSGVSARIVLPREVLSKRKLVVRLTTQPSNGTPLTQAYTLQR